MPPSRSKRSGEFRGSPATSGPLPLAQPERQRPAPSTGRRRRAFSKPRRTVTLPAYVGKILDGAKLSELPVVTQMKLRLAINVEIAGTLGVDVPATLFA